MHATGIKQLGINMIKRDLESPLIYFSELFDPKRSIWRDCMFFWPNKLKFNVHETIENTAEGYGVFNSRDKTGAFLTCVCRPWFLAELAKRHGLVPLAVQQLANQTFGWISPILLYLPQTSSPTEHTSKQWNWPDYRREEINRVTVRTLPFMFHVMIHTQSTQLVVNSHTFWIGIVFMPSWVPPSSIETRLLFCSWLLLQCYIYQEVQQNHTKSNFWKFIWVTILEEQGCCSCPCRRTESLYLII